MRSLGPFFSGVQVQETILSSVSRVENYCSYRLLKTRQIILLEEALCNHDIKELVVGLCPAFTNFTKNDLVALLVFLADPNVTLDSCGVRKYEAV